MAHGFYWIGDYPERTEEEELKRCRLRDEADEQRYDQENDMRGAQCLPDKSD
jgi:hypothetical protein